MVHGTRLESVQRKLRGFESHRLRQMNIDSEDDFTLIPPDQRIKMADEAVKVAIVVHMIQLEASRYSSAQILERVSAVARLIQQNPNLFTLVSPYDLLMEIIGDKPEEVLASNSVQECLNMIIYAMEGDPRDNSTLQ